MQVLLMWIFNLAFQRSYDWKKRSVHFCWHSWCRGEVQNFQLFAVIYNWDCSSCSASGERKTGGGWASTRALAKCTWTSGSPANRPHCNKEITTWGVLTSCSNSQNDFKNTQGKIDNIHMKLQILQSRKDWMLDWEEMTIDSARLVN